MRPRFQDALVEAREAVEAVYGPMTGLRTELEALLVDERAACLVVFFLAWQMEQEAFRDTATILRYTTGRFSVEGRQLCHADLIRDLFGPLPFHEIRIDPGWLSWNDSTVRKLAQAIYDERILPEGLLDQSRLAILEEAGCDNEEILSHLPQQGAVHVRGCWAIDLLLGKEQGRTP
jgi:hypothetical protein